MSDAPPLPPGSTIGILGGGQLGRMLALAAARLGHEDPHLSAPIPTARPSTSRRSKTVAAYDDEAALAAFAAGVDVITYEFENVPAQTAALPRRPEAAAPRRQRAGGVAGPAGREGLPRRSTASRWRRSPPITDLDRLEAELEEIGTPAVLKTTRLGYDGKGQRIVRNMEDAALACELLSPKPLVLEGFIPFEKEISVVVARNASGEVAAFDPAENVHRDHILKTSTVPADITGKTAKKASRDGRGRSPSRSTMSACWASSSSSSPGGKLLVNEIAPRVHNSGHWTEAVCHHRPVRAAHPRRAGLAARRSDRAWPTW